jgi:hypothetical protein
MANRLKSAESRDFNGSHCHTFIIVTPFDCQSFRPSLAAGTGGGMGD